MKRCHIDHITMTAPTLEAGGALVRRTLGVMPQIGGEHPRMGTHNLLLRLGDDLFLEVIAPNPKAPPPSRPRWFALDTLDADSTPALSAWVVRTHDIKASAAACNEALGPIEPMSRGAHNWLITIPEDGALPLSGMAPALIEWKSEPHPAANLHDHGLSLARLEIFHPEPERIARLLVSIDLAGPVTVSPVADPRGASIVAHINTPLGLRLL